MLAEHGEALRPGDVVLSGNPTDSVYLQPGCLIEAHIERLGRASLHTVS
jgi:2-keto-4-pentenoate hydratase